jgi:hypothetical protein
VTVVGSCDVEGRFLPPVVIQKGSCKKGDRSFGLPPGCEIYMNSQKAHIITILISCQFKEIFVPRKSPEKII